MSDKDKNRNVLSNVISVISGLAIGVLIMWLCQRCSPQPEAEPIIIHDSILVQDSSWLAEHTKPKYVVRRDTLYVQVPVSSSESDGSLCDGSMTKDSIAVEVPIMAYEYRDTFATDTSSIQLAVHFSGYNAKIDSTELNYNFVVQPRIVEKKKGWGQFVGIGVGVGYGASVIQNQVFAAPQIGVSVVYGFGYHW